MPWPLNKRVEVEWRDSIASGGWDTVDKYKAECDVGPFRSCGYLVAVTRDVVQVAQSMGGNSQQHINDVVTIPREAVTKIRYLKGGLS